MNIMKREEMMNKMIKIEMIEKKVMRKIVMIWDLNISQLHLLEQV